MGDEKLRETEQLLKEAADWEPEREAPDRLAQLALAAALSQDRDLRPRRPSAGAFFLALVFGGGAATAALSGTLLMVMSRPAETPLAPLRTPKASLAGYQEELPPLSPPEVTAPVVTAPPAPARTAARHVSPRRRRPKPRLAAAEPRPRRELPRAVWTTEEVTQRKEGVLAPGVLVEPDPQNGVVHLLPAIVDIPVVSSACGPPMPPASEALLPPPPTFPEFEPGFDQEAPR